MKKIFTICMILCSLLSVSAVSYASDGEKTIKSEVYFDVGNVNVVVVDAIPTMLNPAEMEITFLELQDPVVIGIGKNSLSEFFYSAKIDVYELNELYTNALVYLWESEPTDYGIRIHNKALYNSKVNKGHTHIYKSDLIRSNSFRSQYVFS
jgi:hypothetical protein